MMTTAITGDAGMIKVTSLVSDAREAYYAAIEADNAWQAELNRLKVDRYSKAARGDECSELRRLYEAKCESDRKRHELTELVRRYQDPRQVGLE